MAPQGALPLPLLCSTAVGTPHLTLLAQLIPDIEEEEPAAVETIDDVSDVLEGTIPRQR